MGAHAENPMQVPDPPTAPRKLSACGPTSCAQQHGLRARPTRRAHPDHQSHDGGNDVTLVFVICSFAPEMEPVYAAIAAAASRVGLRAERVKDVQGDHRPVETILEKIRRARLVVADLTHERPNVYFELGYARALGKTVVTLLRAGTAVHFDVRDWVYLEYFDSRPLEGDLIERFRYELRASGGS